MRQIGRVNRQSVQELKGQILKLQNELGRQQMCNNNNTNSYMNIIKIEKEGWEHKVQQLTMQINEKVELQRQIEQIKMEIEKQARQRQELQAIYNQEKQQLCMEISRLNTRNEYMEEENAKLNKSINQLTQSINQNCLQFNNYMQTDNHNHKEKVQKLLHRIKQVEMDKYRVQEVVEEQKREILRMQE